MRVRHRVILAGMVREVLSEEMASELNKEGGKIWNGGNERGRNGTPGRPNSMTGGREAGNQGLWQKGER